jgi:beta-mannosidase
VVRRALPAVPYWPSTPSGDAVPFRTDLGTAHYFGVGAYRRPLDDARRAEVKFTTECLAFAHLPEPESPATLPLNDDDADARARWFARVPRDGGAHWNFEDVRDHYVSHLFGVDSSRFRREETSRYLALGRAATAIAVERTFQEWRRSASPCQGALTWLWSDPWSGAGWGYVDGAGRPKSSWYAMRRASRSVAIALTNEGLNGVDLHVWNDRPRAIDGTLHLRLLRDGAVVMHSATIPLHVNAGSSRTLSCEEILGRFVDIAYAYRFGPPSHDVVHAIWTHDEDETQGGNERGSTFGNARIIDEAVLLPHGDLRPMIETGLHARVVDVEQNGAMTIQLTTERIAQMVRIGSAAYRPEDSYFTLLPGVERRVRLIREDSRAASGVVVEALNDPITRRIELPSALGVVSALHDKRSTASDVLEREVAT